MRVVHKGGGPLLRWWVRPKIVGAEHLPLTGGLLLASNHRSFLDHYLLGAASPRPIRFLGKRSLATGVVGRMNVELGMVPVDRGKADLVAIAALVELLRQGEVVTVFPEGTRSVSGLLYRFRSGLARLAAEAQVPVVPVGMTGTAEYWPREQKPSRQRPKPGAIAVHFGEPVSPPPMNGPARRRFTEDIYVRVAMLCGQPQANTFAVIPDS